MIRTLLQSLIVSLLAMSSAVAVAAAQPGLQAGQAIPAISLVDQAGIHQSFGSLKGPKGLLILFNRSADWCPFCKSQLIDLETSRHLFEQKGINVVAVTYDSPEVLKSFALRRGIHYKLLADIDSKLIDAFGIRNTEATGSEAGIPVPNYYLIDAKGIIVKRHAETGLTDRVTASYFYEAVFGAGNALPTPTGGIPHTPHVKIELLQSDHAAAPGARVRLTVKIDAGKDAHLYAPGSDTLGYHSVKLLLDSAPLYSVSATQYPKSTILDFAQLHEKVPVYNGATTLTQDITPVRSIESITQFDKDPHLILKGVLEYQACTSAICYPPAKVRVQWTLEVRPDDLDSVRVPENLRRR
jgi:peroxiredoxin